MANNNGCGCSGHRNSNNGYGCLNNVGMRYRWDNYPYYPGPCPDADGVYDCGDEDRNDRKCRCRKRRRRPDFGVFTAMAPMAVAANGIIPLVNSNCMCIGEGIAVNSGMITVAEEGTYLATYSVRVPEGAELASTITLNVNDASQSTAVAEVGGAAPFSSTAQAIFEVGDHATVTLRSSEPINVTESSQQPLFTLSMIKLD